MKIFRCSLIWVVMFLSALGGSTGRAVESLTLDASTTPPPAVVTGFHMGTSVAPGGHTLTVDSRGLLRDGVPFMALSGEFHFSRYPQSEWRDELLKMKAGGVTLVSTYIFWIHHEEVEGHWDWTGQRDLRTFVNTCHDVGLNVLVRIGPWAHGEVRNGGFPDWLQKKGDDKLFALRRDNPAYLGYVRTLYEQIAQQVHGLLWKDGGPIIAVQLENEYSGPAQHLMTLKKMAREVGIDVPLYTCTGWGGGGSTPFGEIVPLSGAYAEGFWDRTLAPMPRGYAASFRFIGSRRASAAAMGAVGTSTTPATSEPGPTVTATYPSFTCELGGGMMSSYHRRIYSFPEDAESIAMTRLGSGANLLGFYMYHGGENPDGALTTLNETQATHSWNDLPVKNYDFQAPLGEFGQEREHYHWLRLLGLFLQDFGTDLSGMTPRLPDSRNSSALPWAVRSNGKSGYLFVSNYLRLSPQPARQDVQFHIQFAGGTITLPTTPVTIPDNTRFIWPLNLDLGGVTLISATAQPICHIDDHGTRTTAFTTTAGVPAEFVFDAASTTVDASTGTLTTEGNRLILREVRPGTGAAVRLHGADGKAHVILLFDEHQARDLWKASWLGADRLFLTHAQFLPDGSTLRLRTENPADASLAMLPAPATLRDGDASVPAKDDGIFRRFTPAAISTNPPSAIVEAVQPTGPARTIPLAPSASGKRPGMAMQPEDADFATAAVWRIKLPPGIDPDRDLLLRIHYTGDVARAYLGDHLLVDDFYNSRPFDIGLHRYGPDAYRQGLLLKILPLREDAPIYLTDRSHLIFGDNHTALTLGAVDILETHETQLRAGE